MGSYDGSETAEIVGLFILSKLTSKFGIGNVGLYRDDGLAIMKNVSGPRAERMKPEPLLGTAHPSALALYTLSIIYLQTN